MSFKLFWKLFRPYLEYVRHFKERYFIMKLLTEVAIDSLYTRVEEIEDRQPVYQLVARFMLEWQWKHFDQKPEYYVVKPEDLDS